MGNVWTAGDETMQLFVSDEEEARAAQELRALGLEEGERYAAANPGASFGASKFWTLEGFAATITGLRDRQGLRTLVLCGPGEEDLAHRISREAGPGVSRVFDDDAIEDSCTQVCLRYSHPASGPRDIRTHVDP